MCIRDSWKGGRKNVSETNKKEAGVQEETEKDLPETEPVTEPVEESPEATAGTETTEETESAAEDDKESDKETKGRNSFFGKKKKDNKLEQQIEDPVSYTHLSLNEKEVNVRC